MTTPGFPRIGYISTCQFPSRETDTQQVMATVDAVHRAGIQIDLIVPRPYLARWPGDEAFAEELYEFYRLDGRFKVITFPTVPPSPIELERPCHSFMTALRSRNKYHLWHTRNRGPTLASWLIGQPLVYETYRLIQRRNPIFSKLLKPASRSSAFRGAIAHSNLCADALAKAGVPREKIATVYNGFNGSERYRGISKEDARARLNIPDAQAVVSYTGNLLRGKGLSVLYKLAEALPHVHFRIIGGIDRLQEVEKKEIERRHLRNVAIVGWKPTEVTWEELIAADILIIPPSEAALRKYGHTVLPIKTFQYLAAGKPILAPDLPDVREILTDNDNAILTKPDDIAMAADALRRLLSDVPLAKRLGEAAKASSRQFTWDERAKKLAQFYDRCLQ